ncbi:RNA-binding protein 45 [Cloeon dipterum]|uniref:RNA-binding protein 45 n=1 Tax=Cloeon dipterum TaxID=197152 RepID=UPI00321FB01F
MNDRRRADDIQHVTELSFRNNNNNSKEPSKYDDPPNSRLFIVCDKHITEKEFQEAFSKFGTIEEIWFVKDKSSGEPKGVVYIKFSKTSEAASAMEEMNGSCIPNHPRPLKVMIAASREQGSRREVNEEERLLRLFVMVPKSITQKELEEIFSQFGDIDYVSIVKDHETKVSKGFAYIKYHRASHAAKAFEGCDKSFKPVFAEPKPQKSSGPASEPDRFPLQLGPNANFAEAFNQGDACSTTLNIIASHTLNQDQLWRLFDIVPGMDYLQLIPDPVTGQFKGHAVAVYKYPQAAAFAREKLHGFEYPIGQRLIVKLDAPLKERPSLTGAGPSTVPRHSIVPLNPQAVRPEFTALPDNFVSARAIIQVAATNPGIPAIMARPADKTFDPRFCSVPLPPPQNCAPYGAEVVERLFIVCQPSPPAVPILKDVFSRFGNLIDVYLIGQKTCGYVKYASKESAELAMKTLHGEMICGRRLKVLPAEPAKDDVSRKRVKMEY